MRTFMPKKEDIKREWLLLNAEGKILGRLASEIAKLLMGKHKTIYTPHIDVGDYVIVINSAKIRLTGKKWDEKMYYRHSQYPGGLRSMTAKEVFKKNPSHLIYLAVKRMLPKNKLGRHMLRRLKIYPEDIHPHIQHAPKLMEV